MASYVELKTGGLFSRLCWPITKFFSMKSCASAKDSGLYSYLVPWLIRECVWWTPSKNQMCSNILLRQEPHGVFLKFSRATWLRRPLSEVSWGWFGWFWGLQRFFFLPWEELQIHGFTLGSLGPWDLATIPSVWPWANMEGWVMDSFPHVFYGQLSSSGAKKIPNDINEDYKIPRKQYFWPKKWMKFLFETSMAIIFGEKNLLETTISLQRRNLWSRWFSFYQGGIWRNRGHEITRPPPLKKGNQTSQKCLVRKSGLWISPWKNGALSLFGSVWFDSQTKKVTNSLPKPTQPNKNPPFGVEPSPPAPARTSQKSPRRRPCRAETLAARSCRAASIHPSWRSNNRRNRR